MTKVLFFTDNLPYLEQVSYKRYLSYKALKIDYKSLVIEGHASTVSKVLYYLDQNYDFIHCQFKDLKKSASIRKFYHNELDSTIFGEKTKLIINPQIDLLPLLVCAIICKMCPKKDSKILLTEEEAFSLMVYDYLHKKGYSNIIIWGSSINKQNPQQLCEDLETLIYNKTTIIEQGLENASVIVDLQNKLPLTQEISTLTVQKPLVLNYSLEKKRKQLFSKTLFIEKDQNWAYIISKLHLECSQLLMNHKINIIDLLSKYSLNILQSFLSKKTINEIFSKINFLDQH